MPQFLSAGVFDTEIDLSTYIAAVSTSVAGFVGNFEWGPVYSIETLTNKNTLVSTFGNPNANNYVDWWTAANFLEYSTTLKLVRAVDRATAKNSTADGNGFLIESEQHWRENYANGSAPVGGFAGRFPGDRGNALFVSYCPAGPAFNSIVTTTVTSNSGNSILSFSGNVAADATRPLQVGDQLRIGANTDWLSVVAINQFGNTVTVNSGGLVITSVANTIVARWGYAQEFDYAPGTSEYAADKGGANDEIHIIVVDRGRRFSSKSNTVLARVQAASVASDAKLQNGVSNYYPNAILTRTKEIFWMGHPSGGTNWGNVASNSFTIVNKPGYLQLSGGVATSPISDGNLITAYQMFSDKEAVDVSLMLTAGHSTTVKNWVLTNIAGSRQDCVAFIGPQKNDVVLRSSTSDALASVIATKNLYPSSSYGFFIDNWKYQLDPINDTYWWLPLDGDVAGLAARTDNQRDAWFSFAGFNRGQIKNVVKLAWRTDRGLRDELYRNNINPIVNFIGEGPILYGDKTMQTKTSSFDRINVRRLFIVLRKAISAAAKYSLFEFNDSFTRAQFVALIEPYLRDVQGRRGIYDFRVVCDETNNTSEVIDRNEFRGDIYIKPAKSINYIQLNFVAVGTGVAFEEVAGRF